MDRRSRQDHCSREKRVPSVRLQPLGAIPTLLGQYHQSVLAAAFRGDLTADWRTQNPDIEPVETKDNEPFQGDIYGTFGGTNSGEIPETWRWLRLGRLGSISGGGTPSKKNPAYWNGNIPWISPKDMKVSFLQRSKDPITEQGLSNSSVKLIPENSILFVVRGMILAHSFPVAINTVKVTINQDMKAITPWPSYDYRFLLYALQHLRKTVLGLTSSSTHGTKRLESTRVLNLAVPIPPIQEQREIVHCIEGLLSRLDVVREQYLSASGHLDSLTQSILAKAFRGELVPQDPSDEPASVLLHRIRMEGGALAATRTNRSHKKTPPVGTISTPTKRKNAMGLKRTDVANDCLTQLLKSSGGDASAEKLWQQSELDIDEFYKQLRDEMKAGRIREGKSKQNLELTNAA